MNAQKSLLLILCLLGAAQAGAQTQAQTQAPAGAPTLSATEIVRRVEENRRGKSVYSEMKMTLVRPTWTRQIETKSWEKGGEYALTLIVSPAKEKGQAFLKRGKDLWNWQPSIQRMIKMSSSMMGQSWMGSDFTNDDLIKESSLVNDYTHHVEKKEKVREAECYQVVLTPKEKAAVVWGKVVAWVSVADFIEMKVAFYDEDNTLVSTLNAYDIKTYGSRRLASRLEVVPADKPNQKTVLQVEKYDFDMAMEDSFFSQQNMQRVK